ncbi:MAG: hypothetical protein MUF44_01450 [Hydrogenophaga sp.]|jgi:hypothetical protein|nr:hypothetical protein [Hydrogenophaga sp.]
MESQPASTETWKRRATRLLRHCDIDGHFRIDARGVWPVEPRDTIGDDGELKQFGKWRSSPDGNTGDVFGQWRPARVLAAKGYEIDPADTPALPFPFDAKKLAAFMVNGMGAFVAEWYCDGDWDNGLSIEVLERSLPVDETWLRQTVKEAIDAYRAAKEALGSPDGEHPDPDEIVWKLLKTDDAPAAPPNGQQNAPKRNAATYQIEQKPAQAYRQKRRDLLAPVIEKAQVQSGNRYDAAAVWNVLVTMAKIPDSPLIGVSDEGIKWSDGNDGVKFLKLKNLRDRLKRERDGANDQGSKR